MRERVLPCQRMEMPPRVAATFAVITLRKRWVVVSSCTSWLKMSRTKPCTTSEEERYNPVGAGSERAGAAKSRILGPMPSPLRLQGIFLKPPYFTCEKWDCRHIMRASVPLPQPRPRSRPRRSCSLLSPSSSGRQTNANDHDHDKFLPRVPFLARFRERPSRRFL